MAVLLLSQQVVVYQEKRLSSSSSAKSSLQLLQADPVLAVTPLLVEEGVEVEEDAFAGLLP